MNIRIRNKNYIGNLSEFEISLIDEITKYIYSRLGVDYHKELGRVLHSPLKIVIDNERFVLNIPKLSSYRKSHIAFLEHIKPVVRNYRVSVLSKIRLKSGLTILEKTDLTSENMSKVFNAIENSLMQISKRSTPVLYTGMTQ